MQEYIKCTYIQLYSIYIYIHVYKIHLYSTQHLFLFFQVKFQKTLFQIVSQQSFKLCHHYYSFHVGEAGAETILYECTKTFDSKLV